MAATGYNYPFITTLKLFSLHLGLIRVLSHATCSFKIFCIPCFCLCLCSFVGYFKLAMAVCTVFLWFFIYLGCDEVGDSQTTGLVDEQWLDLLVDRPHRHTDSHCLSNQIMSFTKISSPELEERESVVFELHQATPSPDDDNPHGPEATPLGRKRSASSQSLPVTGLTANNNSHKELTQTLSEEEKPTIFSSDPPSTEQLAPAPKASWTRRLSAKMGHMTGLSINKGRLTNQSRSQSALPTSSHSSGFFQDQRSLRKTKTGKNG